MPREIDITEVLVALGDSVRDSIRKTIPAIVTQVHGQTVDVQVAIKNPLYRPMNLGGDPRTPLTFEDAPILSDVPWGTLAAAGFTIWIPPAVGNMCMLHFTDLSMDVLRGSDGSQPVQPGMVDKHSMDSAVAVPYFRVEGQALHDAPPGTMVVGVDGQSAQIRIAPGSIQLGSTGGDHVALASKVDTIMSALQNFAAGIVPGTPIVASSTGIATPTFSGLASALAGAVAPTGSPLVGAQ